MASQETAIPSPFAATANGNLRSPRERYRPGLLDLGLNASTHGKECTTATAEKLAKEYDKDKYTASYCAALNLKGTFLYFKNKYDEAINVFKDIIEIDTGNLNARANLEFIYKELGYWTKADKVKKVEAEDRDGLFRARYFGEQGLAMMFDHIVSLLEKERYERGLHLFEKCIKSNCFHPISDSDYLPEAVQWNLWYVQFIHRYLFILKEGYQIEEEIIEKYIKEGLGCLLNIIDNEHKIEHCKVLLSVTYMCIGQFMNKIITKFKQNANGNKEAILKWLKDEFPHRTGDIDDWVGDQKICFEKAINIYSNEDDTVHPPYEVLVRYARFLISPQSKKDCNNLELAEKLLKKLDSSKKKGDFEQDMATKDCAEKDCATQFETDHDWFSYCALADTYLELYKYHREEREKNKESPQSVPLPTSESNTSLSSLPEPSSLTNTETSYLDKCLEYGKKSAELKQTLELLTTIGKAYQAKAEHERDNDKKEKFFFKACSYYLHAQKHRDGKLIAYVHVLHGECLFKMQQYRPAVESFKTAIACPCRNPKIYRFLMKSYVELLREMKAQEKPEHPKDNDEIEKLKMEICYWLQYIYTEKQKGRDWGKGIFDEILKKDEESFSVSAKEVVADIVRSMFKQKIAKDMKNSPVEIISYVLTEDYLNEEAPFDLYLMLIAKLLDISTVNEEYLYSMIEKLRVRDGQNFNEGRYEKPIQNIANSFIRFRTSCCYFEKGCDIRVLPVFRKLREVNKQLAKAICEKLSGISKAERQFADLLFEQTSMDLETDSSPEDSEVEACSTLALCSIVRKGLHEKYHRQFSQIEDVLIQTGNYIARNEEMTQRKDSKREPRIRNEKYDYDFYVIHSDDEYDKLWVEYYLLPTLETTHKFVGCLDTRDATPGKLKFDQIHEFIERSFKVIVVITRSFNEDKFCTYKLHSTLEDNLNKNKVIPLLLEGAKLPKELSTIIPVSIFDIQKLVKVLEV